MDVKRRKTTARGIDKHQERKGKKGPKTMRHKLQPIPERRAPEWGAGGRQGPAGVQRDKDSKRRRELRCQEKTSREDTEEKTGEGEDKMQRGAGRERQEHKGEREKHERT